MCVKVIAGSKGSYANPWLAPLVECFMDKDSDFNYIKPCDKRLRVWSISRWPC